MVNPLQQRTTQGYDPAGQQTLRIDARGFRTTYVYDPVGQRTQRRYPDGTRTTWIYDPVGNPLTIAAPAGTFTRTYDPLDQVQQLQWPTGEVLTWTYDAAGNRRSRETSIGTTTYLFDANAQLTKLINEHEEVTTFSYDPVGREVLKELDNGTRSTITYDVAGQILSVANLQENDDVISRFTYLYDPAGNRTQERREDGDLRVFSYDPTNQLIGEERQDSIGISRTTYVYDPVGNRLVLNVDGELTTSTYDAANRLLTAEEINGVTTYTFDANGNQRTIEAPTNDITTYSWSYENQLIQIEAPDDLVTTQVYAPTNRKADELRFSKETEIGTVNFIWDDQNIIQEVDELNSVDAEYTLNPQPYGNLVSQRREDESTFYNYDALGSTQSLTDETGTVSNEYTYSAFGKILNQTGSTENPYTWVGELGYYQDPDGSYTLRRRDYTAEESRFLSEDPLGFAAGDENLYPYVGNSPPNFTDPSGLYYFSYKKEAGGRYAVYYVPESWWGGDLTPIFVGYTDEPAGTWWTLPETDVDRPGICKISKIHFVHATFPQTKEGWDKFFSEACAKKMASQGKAPSEELIFAPKMCVGSEPGEGAATCSIGFKMVPGEISALLSSVITGLVIEYIPYGKLAKACGWAIKKVGVRCAAGGKKVIQLVFSQAGRKGVEETVELTVEQSEELLKNLRKPGAVAEANKLADQIDDLFANASRLPRNAPEFGGFAQGITPEEIAAINRGLGGSVTLTGDLSTTLANAARREGFWNKVAVIVRDIAGGHKFNDANKRTAQAVVEELMRRNGICTGITAEQMKKLIQRVATGELREIDAIASALRGF